MRHRHSLTSTRPSERQEQRYEALTITLAAYLVTLGSMATIGVIVPLMGQLAEKYGASIAELGFAIGLYSLPAALFSVVAGGIIDRVGPKPAIIISAAIATLSDLAILQGKTLLIFEVALIFAGIANAAIITSAPSLLMRVLKGSTQVRAMSLWSTYGPAGYALGLIICAPFAGDVDWHSGIVILVVLMGGSTAVAALFLPNVTSEPRPKDTGRAAGLLSVLRNCALVRISVAYALVAAVSYGSSLAAPGYLARTYGVSIGSSAAAIACAKIVAMLLGGLAMGWILSGSRNRLMLYATIALLGLAAQFFLYYPGSGIAVATSAMIFWLFAFGGISATSFVMLAQLNTNPENSGIASGLIGQIASIGCACAPAIYFSLETWHGFIMLAATGLLLSLLIFPRPEATAAEPENI